MVVKNFPSLELLDADVRNRILSSVNFQEGDRVPIWDFIDNRGIWEYFAEPGDNYDEGMVRVYHALGIDLCRGYGSSFTEQDDGRVESSASVERKISGRTSWVTRYPIRSLEELKDFRPKPVSWEWVREEWAPGVRAKQESFAPRTHYVPGGGAGFHGTYGLMGIQLFSYAMYECPEELHRIMNVFCENTVRMATVSVELGLSPLFFVGDDVAYKQKLMFSPRYLRRTLIRLLWRISSVLRAGGVKLIYHSDGDITPIVDDLVEAGVRGLNPIEPIAGMDIAYLKRKYYGKLILVGNVDCSRVLPLGTVEDVARATKECLRVASPGGGHFIGSSSEIVPSTPVENILAFYETIREYGKYPIRL